MRAAIERPHKWHVNDSSLMNECSKRPAPQSGLDPLTRAINAEKRRQGAYGGGPLFRSEQVPKYRPPARQSVPAPPVNVRPASLEPIVPVPAVPVPTQPKIVPWPTPMPVDPPPPTLRSDLKDLLNWFVTREPLWQPPLVWAVKIAIFAFALRFAGQLAASFLDILLPG